MFREAIKKKMWQRGISLKTLSTECGVNMTSMSSFLLGKRTISVRHLDNVMHYLGMSMQEREGFEFGDPATTELARSIVRRGEN